MTIQRCLLVSDELRSIVSGVFRRVHPSDEMIC